MALIPPFFIDCVAAIGVDDAEGKRRWVASGFLYGLYVSDNEDGEKQYKVFLVSNRHVFEGVSRVYLRFNPQSDQSAREYPIDLTNTDDSPRWHAHPGPSIDVAVLPINFNVLKEHNMQAAFFTSDQLVANIDKMNELGITEGDFAYVLGFPMGLIGGQRNTVIVRSGSIARIRDTLIKANETFLVDAFIFPGNSGGPVVSKPEFLAITGTKSQSSAYLIGIVCSYLTYKDVAVSRQTGRDRVIFEENSGLAAAHPVDFIEEIIQANLE